MHILIVSPTSVIPADKYGGTERVIWGLGKALIDLGHRVSFLVAKCNVKKTRATIIEFDKEKNIEQQIPDNTDVVHFHTEHHSQINIPNITTIHGNIYHSRPLHKNSVFLTKNHAAIYQSESYVYNGLYWNNYPEPVLNKNRTCFHFLGKASWKVKNLRNALEISRFNRDAFCVLGGKRWTYYNLKRNPKYLFSDKINYLGMVDDIGKAKILQKSKGLIFPVLWEEPFGLAIIESLYYGAPVFGSSYGSLPELIKNEVGLTSNNLKELGEATKTKTFDPHTCHEYARENFNAHIMANSYIELYKKVISGKKLNLRLPVRNAEFNTKKYSLH